MQNNEVRLDRITDTHTRMCEVCLQPLLRVTSGVVNIPSCHNMNVKTYF